MSAKDFRALLRPEQTVIDLVNLDTERTGRKALSDMKESAGERTVP